MDETPVFLDMVGNSTLEVRGKKEVLLQTTGSEKQRIAVALTVTCSGEKLPPMIIFKGVDSDRGRVKAEFSDRGEDGYPRGVILAVQEKAWMNEVCMLTWLNEVWEQRSGALRLSPSLLILDSFEGTLSLTHTNTFTIF